MVRCSSVRFIQQYGPSREGFPRPLSCSSSVLSTLSVLGLAPVPTVYKRRYLVGERLTAEGGEVDFDVMTELVFADRLAFDAWMAELAKPGVGAHIVEDEEKFLNRARTRAYVIEERVT